VRTHEPIDAEMTPGAASDPGWEQLSELYRKEQPAMVRLATLLVRDQAVAEELVQEAFVRLHPKLAAVEQPGAYLRTTVVNLCRGHGRRSATAAAHRPDRPIAVLPPVMPDDLSPVWLAMAELPERQRHALVLRFYLDLPDDQIATLLDARPGTVRSLISRGLAALKEVVEP
jgi:RNA polymerase sigma factor (sigma-70 family)